MDDLEFVENYVRIFTAARASDDGTRCAVSASPETREQLKASLQNLRESGAVPASLSLRLAEPTQLGLNDGVIVPPDQFPLGTAPSVIRSAAADRAPLRGTVRVIVVLADFSDHQMTQTQQHFKNLFFSQGGAQKSVRDYYNEVTNGLIDIQGDVVGPFRMPRTLAQYAHNASGLGNASPNAQTMARDALLAANPTVNFTPYDNDGNGFVDAFIVIHAGTGAETNNNPNDIWSHKWTIEGGAQTVDQTKVFGYLTVPEDCKIGVCAHELGHLLFGFPDLYDTDGSSEGIGNWCLMAAGSWGGGGDKPVHPSAWCKANQGWAAVMNRTTNGQVTVQDVKTGHTVYRLWKDGAPGKEYFLMENRQATGAFDVSLPGSGLLIWHIDENQSSNRDENHYWVALMQADGKRDLELSHNRGDGGDCYPGTAHNTTFNSTSTPNSKSYAGAMTCVAVTGITAPGPSMNVAVQVKCVVKPLKEVKEIKEGKVEAKEKEVLIDNKRLRDKQVNADKLPDKRLAEGKVGDKLSEGRPGNVGRGGPGAPGTSLEELAARVAALEAEIAGMSGSEQPFIGQELRPDLSYGALAEEPDHQGLIDQMGAGSGSAKRLFDTQR